MTNNCLPPDYLEGIVYTCWCIFYLHKRLKCRPTINLGYDRIFRLHILCYYIHFFKNGASERNGNKAAAVVKYTFLKEAEGISKSGAKRFGPFSPVLTETAEKCAQCRLHSATQALNTSSFYRTWLKYSSSQ